MVTVTTIAVVLFGAPLAIALGDLHHEEEVVRLERTAAEASEDVPTGFPHTAAPLEVRKVRGREVGLYGRAGTLLAGNGPRRGDAIVKSALKGAVRDQQIGNRIVVAIPLTRGEHIVGALRASVSDAATRQRTRNDIWVMVAIGALAVAVSALVGWVLSRRITRPAERLVGLASRLGDGDFTVRSETSGVPEVDAVSAALETTAVRLDRMLTRERSFSEDASHQLRTPLTSLRINLEAARLDPSHDLDAVLAAAVDDVDRLDRTIDDLLTLAREAPTPHADTDLAELLDSLEPGWRREMALPGRSLRVVVDPNLPKVLISDRAVRQILDVLVDNARRHGAGAIVVAARPAGSGAVIEVSDEGTGVIADPEGIFERRTSTVGSHGIGLALARALAEAEGARLVLRRPGPQPAFALLMSPGPDHDEPES